MRKIAFDQSGRLVGIPTTLNNKQLNANIHFIRFILKCHKQDQWDMFLDSLKLKEDSLFKINKKLANPLTGPNSLVFTANEKAELIA